MLGSSCSQAAVQPEDAMTVTEFIPQIDALNGRTVSVKGYLGLCMGYDCALFEDQSGSEQWDRFIAAIRAKRRPFPAEPDLVGIGMKEDASGSFDEEFDRKAKALSYSYVIVTGEVTNKCRYKGKPGCTDRTTDIRPTDIQAWRRPVATKKEGSAK
jgi:hypothetical protein